MKPWLKILLVAAAGISIAAVGNIYYEVLPGLVIKHPVTGATTATINGTNGTVTAGYFIGDGSGLTGLPGSSGNMTNVDIPSVAGALVYAKDTSGTQFGVLDTLTNVVVQNLMMPNGANLGGSVIVTNRIVFGATLGTNQLYAVGNDLYWNGVKVNP